MRILLSIKPEFAEKILDGKKAYEFRRVIPKSREVTVVVIYASSPMQKVIGEFKIKNILSTGLSDLWNLTSLRAGIDKDYYDSYFEGKNNGHAFEVLSPKRYKRYLSLSDLNIRNAPQSFVYLDKQAEAI